MEEWRYRGRERRRKIAEEKEIVVGGREESKGTPPSVTFTFSLGIPI